MKNTTALAAALIACIAGTVVNGNDKKPAPPAKPGFPALVMKAMTDIDRFEDPAYFTMLAGDGLRSADAKALFGRIVAASQAGEHYKALYLSRLFTSLQPDNAAGWTNRARLAAQLGFTAEAAASEANAASGARPVVGGALPGSMKVRPATLADWAAAMALTADDVKASEGRTTVVAVKDDLSGVEVPDAELIQQMGEGPWVTAKPVQVEDVLPNMFVMPQATPMDVKSRNGGMFALGLLAVAGSAYSMNVGATEAGAMFSELAGTASGKAYQVPSTFKGGAYVAKTFAGGSPKLQNLTPKTAGKRQAVGTPLALLWATGSSLDAAVSLTWRNGDSDKSFAVKIDAKNAGKKPAFKNYKVPPTLSYPRFQQFCDAGRCSPMLTVLEVMLSAEDLRALAPDVAGVPDIASWRHRYVGRQPMSVTAAGTRFFGADAKGEVYITRQSPTEWLTTTAAGTR